MTAVVRLEDADMARTRRDFAARINASWQDSVKAILAAGRGLIDAKECLPHGTFTAMVAEDLAFGVRTAQCLMAIARSEFIDDLANTHHGSCLPASWRTLYEMARLGEDGCDALLEDGVIRADMRRGDITSAIKADRRAAAHGALVEASARSLAEIGRRRYAVGVFDPPWRTEAWSGKGLDRSADNHYPTLSPEEIAAMPIADMMLEDSIMFLWATAPLLDRQIGCLSAWGYRYVSHWVWVKTGTDVGANDDPVGNLRTGHGYWSRGAHEILLIGRKGQTPGPPPQVPSSVWAEPFEGHSVKPPSIYQFIADQYAGLPLVEGFARAPRDPRFEVWGNQAEAASAEVIDIATGRTPVSKPTEGIQP